MRERAADVRARRAAGRLAFVDRAGSARRGSAASRTASCRERARQRRRATASSGGASAQRRTSTATPTAGAARNPGHVVGVAESEQICDEDEDAIGLAAVAARRTSAPMSQATIAKTDERDGVHLLVHDRLVPDRERGGADAAPRATPPSDSLPALREPADEHALGDQEPCTGATRAATAPRGC